MNGPAVIFDFDGVIANTEPLHLVATQRALADKRVTLPTREYEQRYLGFNDHDLFAAIARDRSLHWTSADIDQLIAVKGVAFAELAGGGPVIYPAAANCIGRLFSLGLPLAIASGAFSREINAILSAAGLQTCFLAIVGADDYVHGKPAPDPFVEAIRRLGVHPNSAVAIEDSQWGLDSARAAGCATIAVTHTYSRSALAADVVIDSLDEVDADLLRSAVSFRS